MTEPTMTPAEWAAAALKQAETAGVPVALVRIEHLRELLAERETLANAEAAARLLIARGVDDDPCDVDRNGLCQTHWLSPAPCRNAEARRLLGLDGKR